MTTDTRRDTSPTTSQAEAPRPQARVRRARPVALQRRRRRLLVLSAPIVVLLVLLGMRLATLNVVHGQTLAAYESGDAAGALASAGRQGWVNVVERFRAPFAEGDAHVLANRFDLARPAFEEALAQVPKGGVDECRVRVNLGLTYERLGDDATARERPTEAQQYYDKGIRVTRERPPLCDVPEQGGETGQQLQDAQERMEEKSGDPEQGPGPSEEGAGPQTPPVQPTPDPERTPSEQDQQELERQQRENTEERNRQLGNRDGSRLDGAPAPYPKPW